MMPIAGNQQNENLSSLQLAVLMNLELPPGFNKSSAFKRRY